MRNSEWGIKKKETFPTAFGWAGVAASDKGIVRIVLPKASKKAVEGELISAECGDLHPRLRAEPRVQGVRSADKAGISAGNAEQLLSKAVILLQKYFTGAVVEFALPVDIRYYTAFQQAVWRAAAKIPFAETRSYAWIAKRIGNPKAARAVGQAMGANPVPILIP